jgi:hypothetical protein
VSKPGLLNSE